MIEKLDTFGSIVVTDAASGETYSVVRQEVVSQMFNKLNEIIDVVNRLEQFDVERLSVKSPGSSSPGQVIKIKRS